MSVIDNHNCEIDLKCRKINQEISEIASGKATPFNVRSNSVYRAIQTRTLHEC